MATILVTPDALRGKASEVRNYRSQHDEVIAKLSALVNGLNESWKGNAQVAFVSNFESMKGTFTQFSEMLGEYATQMENFANKMDANDQL